MELAELMDVSLHAFMESPYRLKWAQWVMARVRAGQHESDVAPYYWRAALLYVAAACQSGNAAPETLDQARTLIESAEAYYENHDPLLFGRALFYHGVIARIAHRWHA
ncbi:hypothetical protein D7Y13_44795, partial [Corallococcus praedator]